MKPILIAGISIVNLALISYSVAIITQSRKKILSRTVLVFLSLGVVFDISATVCMVIGSGHFITVHGIIGYTSLIAMVSDTFISYSVAFKKGADTILSAKFLRNSKLAYFYWVLAYITGAMIVMMK
ncbi:MAG: hypothetical protein HXX13_05065 [Bacteroidetes bacterium]|nr:hypothetical protein [Bacteroidota bacterium]